MATQVKEPVKNCAAAIEGAEKKERPESKLPKGQTILGQAFLGAHYFSDPTVTTLRTWFCPAKENTRG